MDMIYRFLRKSLWLIALVLTGFIFILNVAYLSEVASTGYETVSISRHFLSGLLMLVIIGCSTVILSNFREKLEKIDKKKLFRMLTVIYGVLAVYLILNVDNIIRADAKTVFNTALAIKAGDYSGFHPGQYMYRYPHQLGLMAYDQIITEFSENPSFAFLVNFLLVVGINYTTWKIAEEVFHDKLTNVFTILFSFAFLPQFFFILFAYGLIPGFFFMMLGFYHCLRYVHSDKLYHLAAMLVSVAIAVALKQNFLIGGIAIAIFQILRVLQNKRLQKLLILPVLFFCMMIPGSLLRQWYGYQADMELDNASPTILWVAMGTDIDNQKRGPGWYDSSCWNLYNKAGYDADRATEFGMEKLQNNVQKIKEEPARARKFFLDKTISQWCDPMYQSVWSGPLEDCGQYTHTDILRSLYTGGTWAVSIEGYLKLLCLSLWLFAAGFLLISGKNTAGWEPMYLYFIGGLLFHTVWEGKSQYTYPYLFVLIPFAAYGLRSCLMRHK